MKSNSHLRSRHSILQRRLLSDDTRHIVPSAFSAERTHSTLSVNHVVLLEIAHVILIDFPISVGRSGCRHPIRISHPSTSCRFGHRTATLAFVVQAKGEDLPFVVECDAMGLSESHFGDVLLGQVCDVARCVAVRCILAEYDELPGVCHES